MKLAENQRNVDWNIGVFGKVVYIFGNVLGTYYKFDVEANTIVQEATGTTSDK